MLLYLSSFQEAIEAVLEEEQLQKVPSFISKVIQVTGVHAVDACCSLSPRVTRTFEWTRRVLRCGWHFLADLFPTIIRVPPLTGNT